MEVLPGAEYRLEPDLPERLPRGGLLTLNDAGRHLLVELPGAFLPPYTERVLYELQLLGVTPVIAHPERNAAVARNPAFLRRLVSRGMLVQVTADSVTGRFGREARHLALSLLKEGLAHLVASDAHYLNGRPPVLFRGPAGGGAPAGGGDAAAPFGKRRRGGRRMPGGGQKWVSVGAPGVGIFSALPNHPGLIGD